METGHSTPTERLRCVVERITYQNETNGYAINDRKE